MANTFSTSQLVLYKTLRAYKNNLKFVKSLDSKMYSKYFGQPGNKIGNAVYLRKPMRFKPSIGQSVSPTGLVDVTFPIIMSTQANVAYNMSSAEEFLSADDIFERYGKNAAIALSNKVDFDTLQFAVATTPNVVGQLGVNPTDDDPWLTAGVAMDNNAAPMDEDRYLGTSPRQMKVAVKNDQALFNHQGEIGKQYKTAVVGEAHGFAWWKSQNQPIVQAGTYAGTPVVNGANQTGSNLITNGWTAGSLSLGINDSFTLPGVFATNPQSRNTIGALQPFKVTGPITDTSGSAVIPIYPAITPTGAYQNVTNSPANGAAIQMSSASGAVGAVALAYHTDAFAPVYGKLQVPKKGIVDGWTETDPDTNISMRYLMYYDGDNDLLKVRWDVLYGYGAPYPEWAAAIQTAA